MRAEPTARPAPWGDLIAVCNHGYKYLCCNRGYRTTKESSMAFVISVAILTVVYVVVARLERLPALRFRQLPAPRPYFATDLAWYGLAIAATAFSVFVLRGLLVKLGTPALRHAATNLPVAIQFLIAIVIFDFVSFAVHVGLHR